MKKHKYIIARYGAYISIWEIANEAYVEDSFVKFIANEIKSYDYEHRPISMSRERPGMDEVDIISPHWYETEPIEESDLKTLEQIEKYKQYSKPVVFGEQGNKDLNWDETSAARMRIRSWVAFFNEAIIIFWNLSDDKSFYDPVLQNANIFIGKEERSFMKILQDFTKNISLAVEIIPLPIDNKSVRSYGLQSDKELLGYFFHHSNQDKQTTFSLNVSMSRSGTLNWVDPVTGKVISSIQLKEGLHTILSPDFSVDLALKAVYLED